MGHWTWLRRYDVAPFDAALARGLSLDTILYDERAGVPPVEEMTTGRAWHAIHVALTGREEGGDEPAVLVVWGGRDANEASYGSAWFLHRPDRVRVIADYLDRVDAPALLQAIGRAVASGIDIYSLEKERPRVSAVFAELRRFYRAAADAAQLVIVSRS